MNAAPKWDSESDEWYSKHKESIDRIFVALRREYIQTKESDPTFQIALNIEAFAVFCKMNALDTIKYEYTQLYD